MSALMISLVALSLHQPLLQASTTMPLSSSEDVHQLSMTDNLWEDLESSLSLLNPTSVQATNFVQNVTPWTDSLDASLLSEIINVTLISANESGTFLPSSVIIAPSSSVFKTTTTSAPTMTDPINNVRCGSQLVLPGVNTYVTLKGPGLIEYRCKEGFRENGTGDNLIECINNNRWEPNRPLQCQPIEEDSIQGFPGWIPILVIVLVVVLVLALFFLLALALYVFRGKHFKHINHHQQPPAPLETKETGRRWPWQKLPKPPPGFVGADGVAWNSSPDADVSPVKRRL